MLEQWGSVTKLTTLSHVQYVMNVGGRNNEVLRK